MNIETLAAKGTSKSESTSFKLIVHIGAGKAGSSSIQESLSSARQLLKVNGHDYWGLMLEYAPVHTYEWQKDSASKQFLGMSEQEAKKQLVDVLMQSIVSAQESGIRAAIWSNEWLFRRHKIIIPALKAIEEKGTRVCIIAYVRNHDAWAKSAYLQWGLKHKTYKGPLIPFKEYFRTRPIMFGSVLETWSQNFSNSFTLRNFDAVQDVVQDFSEAIHLPVMISSARVNEAPGPEELFLRALFNNEIDGESAPVIFDKVFSANRIDFNMVADEWIKALLPTNQDLEEVASSSAKDKDTVNSILASQGLPVFGKQTVSVNSTKLDSEKMLSILMQIVVGQARKLHKLQKDIQSISKENSIAESSK